MKRPIWVLNIKIACIDAGIEVIRISLSRAASTGMRVILSPDGAVNPKVNSKDMKRILIMVINLLINQQSIDRIKNHN